MFFHVEIGAHMPHNEKSILCSWVIKRVVFCLELCNVEYIYIYMYAIYTMHTMYMLFQRNGRCCMKCMNVFSADIPTTRTHPPPLVKTKTYRLSARGFTPTGVEVMVRKTWSDCRLKQMGIFEWVK